MTVTAPAVSIGKARVTLPDPAVLENVRFLIRNGYAVAYSRGRAPAIVWEAATVGSTRTGPDTWTVTLPDGRTVGIVRQDCNCHS